MFLLLFTSYIFSSCLRVAYALPTPLQCFPTRGLFVLICLRVPTLTNCFLILPTRLACVASVGFLLVLILHILPTRWAPVLSVEVVFFVLLGATSHITTTKHNLQYHNKTLPPTPPTQKKILTNILQMPTKSLRAQAKCLRQHFTRHTLYKLNLPTKKRCSSGVLYFVKSTYNYCAIPLFVLTETSTLTHKRPGGDYDYDSIPRFTQESFDQWFSSLPIKALCCLLDWFSRQHQLFWHPEVDLRIIWQRHSWNKRWTYTIWRIQPQ